MKNSTIDECKERWRPVRGFEGFYEVSNFARVRSISRIVKFGRGERLSEGRILIQSEKMGYQSVFLTNGKNKSYKFVHRIVAEAFVAGAGQVVRHLDGNPKNSLPINLAWGTYSDNEADKAKHGRSLKGFRHHNCKITAEQIILARKLCADGYSQIDTAKAVGINRATVGYIVRGQRWSEVL